VSRNGARSADPADWIHVPAPRPWAELRLVCFPYAGGRGEIFADWSLGLPHGCEVAAVAYPGRGARLDDPPVTSAGELAAAAAEAVRRGVEEPFAFFGHSMGALIAFETARELRRTGGPLPTLLAVAGQGGPQLPVEGEPVHALPDDELLATLREMGGTPDEVLASEPLMNAVLPALRGDFEVCETYRYADEEPLPCPILALAATRDSEAAVEDVERWREQTSADFRLRTFGGGHFFLETAQPALLQCLAEELGSPPG
jgi:medium-chain acyl-[acyl-carrier-protein] hydrolase